MSQKDIDFLIEQILEDTDAGYLVEGISKHAPQSYVDRVKKDPSMRNRRPWDVNVDNTHGSIEDVTDPGYVLGGVGYAIVDLISSFYDGVEVPSPEELASIVMDEIRERADSFSYPIPSPKEIVAAVHNYLQERVLKKINNRERSSHYSNAEYQYIHEGKRKQIALMKVARSPQFAEAIKQECKRGRFKPKNILRNIFGKKGRVPKRLKNV
ncbi:MAG: hypothetical protein IKU15_02485 [Clostridia bacterium]|nr:hypothetical protein [Clostridia bacterium]